MPRYTLQCGSWNSKVSGSACEGPQRGGMEQKQATVHEINFNSQIHTASEPM